MARPKKTRQNDSATEVNFEEIEDFRMNAPVLNEQNSIVVTSNFDEVKGKIASVVGRYKNVKLTEDNVPYVKTVKKHLQSLRLSVDRERKDWTKIYIDPAKNTMKAMCDELQKIIEEGESAIDAQLEEYDQRRRAELTEVLNGYREDAVARHGLRKEYADLVVLKEKYYNKTQAEEDSADDIEAQAAEMEKAQSEHDTSVKLIEAECEGSMLIAENYVAQLKYRTVTEILLNIKADRKKSQQLYEEIREKEARNETVEIGRPVEEMETKLSEVSVLRIKFCEESEMRTKLSEESEMRTKLSEESEMRTKLSEESEMRTRHIVVTYRADQAQLMADFFSKNGIKYSFVKA